MSRILIATDAWHPQVNGVVRTLSTTARTLVALGHTVEVISPERFRQMPIPFYPEIPLSFPWPHAISDQIRRFKPDHIHIATEGPIGLLVRKSCVHFGDRFTTSYHTKFPEYAEKLLGVSASVGYRFLRWFHGASSRIMVSTPSFEADLLARGFPPKFARWSRGVDLDLFQPVVNRTEKFPRPILLYVGRVSAEKGVEAFLKLSVPGTKVVVGDGPARAELESRFPEAQFLGFKSGAALAACYADADLFIFPSRTDTFGLVVIEALACGTPVAAYPVTGPIDILTDPRAGVMDTDLLTAVQTALRTTDRAAAVALASHYTWERCTKQFLNNLVPVSTRHGS